MAVFQDDSKPVGSCIPSHCLLQKQLSNHLKKRAFPINKTGFSYQMLWKSPIRPNINLNSVANLVREHKITFSMQSSHVLLIHTWCMQFCLIADTYWCRTKNICIIERITNVLLSCKGLSSNWLRVKVTQLYWIRNTVNGGYQTYLFQLMPASRDDFKSVCSFILNHCLIQKYLSNQSNVYLSFTH